MKTFNKMTLLSAALAAFLLPATAQTSSSSSPDASSAPTTTTGPTSSAPTSSAPKTTSTSPSQNTPETGKRINQRKENQQDRIGNGISNGELTAGEAGSLEKKESQINSEEQQMRKADDGHLTTADREKLQQQQNQVSHQIYQDKHNAATQYDGSRKVGQRAENQQDRIASGVKSGELTAGETSNLEKQEAAINQEKRADRAANGGPLTAQEKAKINRQQNHLSHEIYKDKHNKKRQ
jgi:hypothetical protein